MNKAEGIFRLYWALHENGLPLISLALAASEIYTSDWGYLIEAYCGEASCL